jgi:hypothetical protein
MSKRITIGLLEASKTSSQTFARNLQDLSKQYGSTKKIFIYVKDEDANLNTMTITLKLIVSCEALGAMKSFQGIWFEHAFSKACQYVTTKERIFKGLKYVFY